MQSKAEDLVAGRWPDILCAAGLDAKFFTGRQGPCPMCGGTDRYRWNNKRGPGLWVCSHCTESKYASGFQLLMLHMGYREFKEAADHVRHYFGDTPPPPVRREWAGSLGLDALSPETIARNIARMERFCAEASPVKVGDPVWKYLKNRVPTLDFVPENLLFHPALQYWAPPEEGGGKPVLLGSFPAMLAKAQGADGRLVQLHKTYLTTEGRKAAVPIAKKTDYGIGVNSFAVRLHEPQGDTLGVSEGIETGLAAMMLRDVPVWPCLNGPAMAQFELPSHLRGHVKRLLIFADHDELKRVGTASACKYRRAGSHYAEQLVQRARSQGLRTLVIKPARAGHDFADYVAQSQTA